MAYANYGQIDIDSTKVSGSSNLTNFTFPVSGTYDGTGGEPDIRTTANGGNVENTASGGASGSLTVPADLVFSPNTDGSTPYDFEIEKYDATTGEIVAWVEIPTLAYDADTTLYMVYGDSSVTTSQEDVAGTWDTNFKGVWHLGEASGTRYDSTSNGNDLADNNTVGSATGQVGTGADFTRANSESLTIADNASLSITGDYTILAWYKAKSLPSNDGDFHCLVTKYNAGTADRAYTMQFDNLDQLETLYVDESGPNFTRSDENTASLSDTTTFHHYAVKADVSAKDVTLFYDGATSADTNDLDTATTISDTDASFAIGQINVDSGTDKNYANGVIDEVWVYSGLLSNDYITTVHNSQFSPSTFYTMGAETEVPSGAARRYYSPGIWH